MCGEFEVLSLIFCVESMCLIVNMLGILHVLI